MDSSDEDFRAAAFAHVAALTAQHGVLSSRIIRDGFQFEGQRIPLVNPQQGIFKPRKMRYLLSIRTVIPRKGAKV